MSRAVMQLALEALEETAIVMKQYIDNGYVAIRLGFVRNAIAAIKEVQAQPEQKPVAWINKDHSYVELSGKSTVYGSHTIPLFTSPPKRQPLTESELLDLAMQSGAFDEQLLAFARAIEAAHGIKEHL